MSPRIDAELFEKKLQKKTLAITLSDGEDLLKSIKDAMKEHGIKECSVQEVNGKIKSGLINFFERGNYRTMKLESIPVLRVSGNFKLSFNDLWGSMHISTAEKKPTTGTLVRGTAEEGLEIRLSFVEDK